MDDGRVHELSRNQVYDIGKQSFYVKLKATKKKHKGRRVYQDAFGRNITIVESV